MLGLLVLHHLPKYVHVHVCCIGDIIQSSHPLSIFLISSHLQSFLVSGSFQESQFFASVPSSTSKFDTDKLQVFTIVYLNFFFLTGYLSLDKTLEVLGENALHVTRMRITGAKGQTMVEPYIIRASKESYLLATIPFAMGFCCTSLQ